MNGLPSLIGSSTCETAELFRLVKYLFEHYQSNLSEMHISEELFDFAAALLDALYAYEDTLHLLNSDFAFWEAINSAREKYIEQIMLGFSSNKKVFSPDELNNLLTRMLKHLDNSVQKSYDTATGLYHTYYYYRVTNYELVTDNNGNHIYLDNGPLAMPTAFERVNLPAFLEGQVRVLKILENAFNKNMLYEAVQNSQLYDAKLKMYKVNAPLTKATNSIGRARIFTPGWLENESVWMHMEYKYLLEVLKSGLCDSFFNDMKHALVPFMDITKYGRSPLEHSSFIVSGAHPTESLHSRGYYARLTGATVEFISMYLIMIGMKKPFTIDEDQNLIFELTPVLPGYLFKREVSTHMLSTDKGSMSIELPSGTFSSIIFSNTMLVYHNSELKNTYGTNAVKVTSYKLTDWNNNVYQVNENSIRGNLASSIRSGVFKRIDVTLD